MRISCSTQSKPHDRPSATGYRQQPNKATTLLYDRFGKLFSGYDRIQERLIRLMHKLGYVDKKGQLL